MQHKYHGMETRHTWSLSLAPHCQEGSGKGRGKQGCTHLWKESQKGGRQTPASSDVSLCLRRMRLRLPLMDRTSQSCTLMLAYLKEHLSECYNITSWHGRMPPQKLFWLFIGVYMICGGAWSAVPLHGPQMHLSDICNHASPGLKCELGLKVLLQTPLILLHEVNAKITSEVWLNIKIYGVLWIKIQRLLLLLPQISRKYKEKKCHVFWFFSWSGFSGIYLLYWPTYYSSWVSDD